MEEKEMITIVNADGEKFEAELVMCFDVEELGKKYIVYSFEDEEEDEFSTIHTSILKEEKDNEYVLEDIEDDNEWNIIKHVMKQVIDETEED